MREFLKEHTTRLGGHTSLISLYFKFVIENFRPIALIFNFHPPKRTFLFRVRFQTLLFSVQNQIRIILFFVQDQIRNGIISYRVAEREVAGAKRKVRGCGLHRSGLDQKRRGRESGCDGFLVSWVKKERRKKIVITEWRSKGLCEFLMCSLEKPFK